MNRKPHRERWLERREKGKRAISVTYAKRIRKCIRAPFDVRILPSRMKFIPRGVWKRGRAEGRA